MNLGDNAVAVSLLHGSSPASCASETTVFRRLCSLNCLLNMLRDLSIDYCLFILLISITRLPCASVQATTPPVPALFVFGDSLVDNGNNNYINTIFKANKPHYGIDFTASGGQPAGRYTNGLTFSDVLGLKMGLPSLIPPSLAPTTKGSAILHGVNYASGGSGILNETGTIFGQRFTLDDQISSFEKTVAELRAMLGEEGVKRLMSKAVILVSVGGNDYLSNYLFPIPYSPDNSLSPQMFQNKLVSQLRTQLTRIYNAGGRKFVVAGVPPAGCTPQERTIKLKPDGDCVAYPNELVAKFNMLEKNLVTELNAKLPGAYFLAADSYEIGLDLINHGRENGFEEVRKACCGAGGPDRGLVPCRPSLPVCPDRSKYFFFDAIHPTQSAYEAIAERFLKGGTPDIFPINVNQLIAL